MNSPIFNPIWIYLIHLSDTFKDVFIACGLIACIIGAIISMCFYIDQDIGDILFGLSEEVSIKVAKFAKKIAIIGAIFAIIGGLTPSKSTIYEMIAASYLTPNNIETVKGTATDLIDYIVEKIDELNDDED